MQEHQYIVQEAEKMVITQEQQEKAIQRVFFWMLGFVGVSTLIFCFPYVLEVTSNELHPFLYVISFNILTT